MNFKNVHGDLAAYEKELSDREGRAERMLPRELGQGAFLQDLQHKALQSQVKLQKVAPAEARSVDGVQEMPVAIACSGSYFRCSTSCAACSSRSGCSPSMRRASSNKCRARTACCSASSSSRLTPGHRMKQRAGRTARQQKRRLLLLNEDRYPLK